MDYEDLDEEVFNDVSSFELVKEMLFARDEVFENTEDAEEIKLYLKPQFTNYTYGLECETVRFDCFRYTQLLPLRNKCNH